MAHRSESEYIAKTHNTARFFTEHRQVSLILLIAVCMWGWYGFLHMAKRKDPSIPVRVAVASIAWPGATAQEVEQLVTRPVEQIMAQNAFIKPPSASDFGIRSISFPALALVYVQLDDTVNDPKKQFSDINLKLNALNSRLPQGAGPIQFNSDFGDTAALMLTVASPKASEIDIALRARAIRKSIEDTRAEEAPKSPRPRISIVYAFPLSVSPSLVRDSFRSVMQADKQNRFVSDPHFFEGSGFIGVDVSSPLSDDQLRTLGERQVMEKLHSSEIHPDSWPAAFIRDPAETEARLAIVAGDKYSYRDLDDFTDLMGRTIQGASEVAKIDRKGVLPEQVYLDYSQQRLAAYGITPANLKDILGARNITLPGGQLEVGPQSIQIDPSGRFNDPQQIGDVIIGTSSAAKSPVYLRDLVDISRGYQSPAKYLNYLTWADKQGHWRRSRAVTLAVQMKDGEQIDAFGRSVDSKLLAVKQYLPDDLIIARTSDQPLQVQENLSLFMDALYEAIALVVLVSWIGFWEWRSALLMAISIPITLAMTFGVLYLMGIDIQQVSVATLIIALGLLVDDPVIAGDSIKRALAEGQPRSIAAWLGPTKLATAILYATVTNIVAYLPFLLVTGSTGEFLHSLPIVMAVALIASRLISMSFLPMLGYYLLRPEKKVEKTLEERRSSGFFGLYARAAKYSIEHRWQFFAGSLLFLVLGGFFFSRLSSAFFPEDVQYWSYIDVWLPNDATLEATNETARKVETLVRERAEQFAREHPQKDHPGSVLRYVTTFVGGGGPRFWFSASPQLQQLNYAQVLIEVNDKEVTPQFIKELQPVLTASIPGARMDARQLLTNPIDYPIEIRISGTADVNARDEATDIRSLRAIAARVEDIFRSIPLADRTRNEWGDENAQISLTIDPDRANLAGITNMDVANSSTAGLSGSTVSVLQEGQKQIPIVARLRMDERSQLSDIQNLYVYGSQDGNKIPLVQISNIDHDLVNGRIVRLEQFRTINIRSFPAPGHLSSEILKQAEPRLYALRASLPPGYEMQIGGEYDKTRNGFKNLATVMLVSTAAIYLALLFQFKNAIKPLLVLAAAPYGMVGAFAALWIMGEPFGFMAFLGVASLIGVIVSHSIVLFDFIEERHAEGDDFELALIDAGILRLRPVLITVGATVLALMPLALHGGPLWKPLCYAQIGGLLVATVVTKLQVPVMYAIFVLDFKILKWETPEEEQTASPSTRNPCTKLPTPERTNDHEEDPLSRVRVPAPISVSAGPDASSGQYPIDSPQGIRFSDRSGC